jgi:hypothetical protein
MPGHILVARCNCGFERELCPGATVERLRVIAYTADGCDLITIESEQAKNESLTVIKDPRLEEEWLGETWRGPPSYGPWGPYRCPSCGQQSLRLEFRGWWD